MKEHHLASSERAKNPSVNDIFQELYQRRVAQKSDLEQVIGNYERRFLKGATLTDFRAGAGLSPTRPERKDEI